MTYEVEFLGGPLDGEIWTVDNPSEIRLVLPSEPSAQISRSNETLTPRTPTRVPIRRQRDGRLLARWHRREEPNSTPIEKGPAA